MKEMKLIMENFRKNMKEVFQGRDLSDEEMRNLDPKMRDFMQNARDSREKAKKFEHEIIQLVKDKYGEDLAGLDMEPKPINSLVAYMKDKYNQKTGFEADERQILSFLDALNVFQDEESVEQGLDRAMSDENDEEFDPQDV
tara:strand:- start:781 stop:1203 length:423 start_codon:yes stop_codon:yes gene_type:complete